MILRREDGRLLRGRARFVDNVRLDRMVHGAFVRSPLPHADIVAVDCSRALVNGALAVLTARDLPFNDRPWIVRYWHPSIRNGLPKFLCMDRVRYVGEPVAFVVASDRYRAEDLARLVDVEYRPLPAVASTKDATAAGAPLLHPQWIGNVAAAFEHGNNGEVARALAGSVHRSQRKFHFPRQAPVPLEARGVIADYDSGVDGLTVRISTQPHYNVRQNLSTLLGIAEDKVRVIAEDVGGGFGAKSRPYPEEIIVAHASRILDRPVKWIEDRAENLQATTHSRAIDVDLEIGCDAQGVFTALKAEICVDIGAYVFTSGIATAEVAAAHIAGAYRLRDVAIAVRCIGTNKTPLGTYRGAGQPEVAFALECLIDVLAKEIGTSAADLRARNLPLKSETPYASGTALFSKSLVFENSDLPATLATALRASGYTEEVHTTPSGERIAYGIGCGVETGGLVNFESARIAVNTDGSVAVTSGMSSQGQGQLTTYAEVCAEALGVPFEAVSVRLGDTQLIPFGRGAFAARGAVMGANAVQGAAERLRAKIIAHAAMLLQCPASALDLQNGDITHRDRGLTDLTITKIARAVSPGGSLFAGEAALEASFVYEAKQPLTSGFSVHVAKVRMDPETGLLGIEDYLVTHDAGRALNRLIVDGQVVGGVVDGIGGALFSEIIYDAGGQLLTASLADYLLATAPEIPTIRVEHVDQPSSTNPLGVRAVGEGGLIPVAAALTNAAARAINPLGTGHEVLLFALPLRPDRIVAAWRRARLRSATTAAPVSKTHGDLHYAK